MMAERRRKLHFCPNLYGCNGNTTNTKTPQPTDYKPTNKTHHYLKDAENHIKTPSLSYSTEKRFVMNLILGVKGKVELETRIQPPSEFRYLIVKKRVKEINNLSMENFQLSILSITIEGTEITSKKSKDI
jgi:hypothetical protein